MIIFNWRHALRSEWPFIINIINEPSCLQVLAPGPGLQGEKIEPERTYHIQIRQIKLERTYHMQIRYIEPERAYHIQTRYMEDYLARLAGLTHQPTTRFRGDMTGKQKTERRTCLKGWQATARLRPPPQHHRLCCCRRRRATASAAASAAEPRASSPPPAAAASVPSPCCGCSAAPSRSAQLLLLLLVAGDLGPADIHHMGAVAREGLLINLCEGRGGEFL